VLNEYLDVLTRKMRPQLPFERAWDEIAMLRAWEPMGTGFEVLEQARAVVPRYHVPWWDALVVSAAQLQDCAVLLSEDFQDGMRFALRNSAQPLHTGRRRGARRVRIASPCARRAPCAATRPSAPAAEGARGLTGAPLRSVFTGP
jgi:hypothetical protein